ncbi:MAG: hypothetical protein ABI273_09235 [Lacunisphaera sp.]
MKKTPRLRSHARGLNIPTALLKSFHPSLMLDDDYSIQTLLDRHHASGGFFRQQAHPCRRSAKTGGNFLNKFRRFRASRYPLGNRYEAWTAGWPDLLPAPPLIRQGECK